MRNTIIETERLFIRDFTKMDAEVLYKIRNDEMVQALSSDFLLELDTPIAIGNYVEGKMLSIPYDDELDGIYAVCLKESGEIIGAIELYYSYDFDENQISWHFDSKYTGQGYASEASSAITDYVIATYEIDSVNAAMDLENIASFRTAEKSGFELVGKIEYYRGKNGEIYYFKKQKENVGVLERMNIIQTQVTSNNNFSQLTFSVKLTA